MKITEPARRENPVLNRTILRPYPSGPSRAAAFAAVLLAALTGCREEVDPPPLITAAPVSIVRVAAEHIVDRIEATGQLIAKSEASIATQVGGEITSIEVEEGDAVVAGQILVRIDPERRELEEARARARLAEADAEVAEHRRETRRLEKLRSSNAISEVALDQARTAVNLADSRRAAAAAELGLVQRALRDSQVTAPFAGFIARREVNRGEFVTPGQTLFELVALDPIEVEFHLAEIDSSRATLGALATVRVAPYPNESFSAVVSVISPTINTSTRTLRVKATLANEDGRLRPGLFARVDLGVSERDDVPMVEEEVVLQRADGSVVFRLDGDNRVSRVNVRLGVYRKGSVEIVEGLKPGDRVVIRGQAELIDGSAVEIRDFDGNLVGAEEKAGLADQQARVSEGSRIE